MADTVLEQIVKTIFGDNWLKPMVILLVAFAVLGFIYKRKLPKYIKVCLGIVSVLVTILLLSFCYLWPSNLLSIVKNVQWIVTSLILLTFSILLFLYKKIAKQLDQVIKNTEPGGNRITAWKELQSIKTTNLTPWQKRKYDKRRLYLRVILGNMCGAQQELNQFENDKPFYNYMNAIILNFRGNHKAELEMVKLAEDFCDGETDPLLNFSDNRKSWCRLCWRWRIWLG